MAGTLVVGDVHGCADLLERLLEDAGLAGGDELILLGDVVDRGPDSRRVLEILSGLSRSVPVVCLRGNHEVMWLSAREDPRCNFWFRFGGLETVRSYAPEVADLCAGIPEGTFAHRQEYPIAGFLDAVPAEHWAFLESTIPWTRRGRYFLCHAGVHPGAASPEESRARNLVEGHAAFPRDYRGAETVVFGHLFTGRLRGDDAPLPFVSPLRNAIGIDSAAYRTGVLTAFRPEDGTFLSVGHDGTATLAFDEAAPEAPEDG